MDLSELLSEGMVKKAEPDAKQCAALLAASGRDIGTAEIVLREERFDWALAIAYNAMLSAGRALMASMGYRPSSDTHHVAVVKFCAAVMPPESSQLVASFNRYRVRRHDVVYGEADGVEKAEAEYAIQSAKKMVGKIKEKLGRKN